MISVIIDARSRRRTIKADTGIDTEGKVNDLRTGYGVIRGGNNEGYRAGNSTETFCL